MAKNDDYKGRSKNQPSAARKGGGQQSQQGSGQQSQQGGGQQSQASSQKGGKKKR